MANTVTPTTAKAYFLTNGEVRDKYGDTLFHPLSNVNNMEIYVEDGDSDNVMTINYNPEVRKKWATHWWPCFYRGLVTETLSGESEPRTFAQYITTMPIILSSMNQNSETPMGVTSTLRQQAGSNLIGSYATVASLPTSYGDWADLEAMEGDDVVAYVYASGVNGFYMVEYSGGSYAWTLQTSGISNHVSTKQYNVWELSVQAGFGNPAELTELTDAQYILIWQELSVLSAYYTSNYELIQDLIDGTTPVGKAVADQNGNVINTTYQLLSNLVTAFQGTPDDTHYASEKLVYDTIQNILDGTTSFPSMTLYNANGNAVFTIDDEGTVRVAHAGINHEMGENLFVRGDEVGIILNGDAIMFDGSIGASGKMNVVAISSSNIATLIANQRYFLGVATQDFSGIQNRLNWYGGVSDLDTTSYTSNATYPAGEGKRIYVDMVNGGLTYIRPAKPLPVIEVGIVVTYHATQGRILVRPTFSVALGDLYDVDLNGGVVAGDVIIRNAGNTKFEPFNLTTALSDAVTVTDGKLALKVDKVTGSSLVTDLEIAHLEALDTQVELDAKIDLKSNQVTTYTKTEVDNLVSSLYRFKGVVATYADLAAKEATAVVGDVWEVTTDENTNGGTNVNYAWTGAIWDNIGGVEALATAVNDGLMSQEDFSKLLAIEASAQLNIIEIIKVNGSAESIVAKAVDISVPVKTSDITNDGDGSSVFVTADDLGSAGYGDMTELEYALNGNIGVVDEAELARTAQQTIVVSLTKGTLGKFYATVAGFSLILNNQFTLLFPDSTTDLTENVSVSLGGVSGTYKNLKYDDTLNAVVVSHTKKAKITAYYNSTELLMKGEPLVDYPATYDTVINSSYGSTKPIYGLAQLDKAYGLLLNQGLLDGNFDSTSNWTTAGASFGVSSNIGTVTGDGGSGSPRITQTLQAVQIGKNWFFKLRFRVTTIDCLNIKIKINGSTAGTEQSVIQISPVQNTWYELNGILEEQADFTGNLVVSIQHSYASASIANGKIMEIDGGYGLFGISPDNTPLHSHTASEINNIVTEYFEGLDWIKDITIQSVGVNLMDNNFTTNTTYVTFETLALNKFELYGVSGSGVSIDLDILPTVKFKPSTQYTFSGSCYEDDDTKNSRLVILYTDGTVDNIFVPDLVDTSFNVTSNVSKEIDFVGFRSSVDGGTTTVTNFQIEEGTSASDYVAHRTDTQVLTNKDGSDLAMLSVGTGIRDIAYPYNGDWWKKAYTAKDTTVIKGTITWTMGAELTNTIRAIKLLSEISLDIKVGGATGTDNIKLVIDDDTFQTFNAAGSSTTDEELVQVGDTYLVIRVLKSRLGGNTSGDFETYLQANDVTFIYEKETPDAPVEIESNGSIIQESVTTIIQDNTFATEIDVTYAVSNRSQTKIHSDKLTKHEKEMTEVEVAIDDMNVGQMEDWKFPATQQRQGATTKPDFDFTNIGLLFPQNDETEKSYISDQRPHSMEEDTELQPHCHLVLTQSGNPKFTAMILLTNIDDNEASWVQYDMETLTSVWASGRHHVMLYNTTMFASTGKTASAVLDVKLYRQTGDGYSGDVLLKSFDIHYYRNKFGKDI